MTLRAEIWEQPEVLRGLLETQIGAVEQVARAIRRRGVEYVFLAARGSSSHAGVYANYLWGIRNRLPVALAAPSLFTRYERPPQLSRALVVGISQSGQSPDIVEVVAEGAQQGALTVAITNDPGSPLARAAAHVLDIGAGVEQAVAATKTFTAQLMIVALLGALLDDAPAERLAELRRVPDQVRAVLEQEQTVTRIAERCGELMRCIVLGRGYSFAAVLETALKLKELSAVAADPYSSAEFLHGPVALVTPGTPVLAIAPRDAVFDDLVALLRTLVHERGADLVLLSDDAAALTMTGSAVRLPAGVPEWLSPLVSIVPAQLFCYHLTCRKGLDPMAPRGLQKVTLTH